MSDKWVCEECAVKDESSWIKNPKPLATKLSAHSYITEIVRNYFQAPGMLSFCKKKLEILRIWFIILS